MKNAVNATARRRLKANELDELCLGLAENILTQICANNARQFVSVCVYVCVCVRVYLAMCVCLAVC